MKWIFNKYFLIFLIFLFLYRTLKHNFLLIIAILTIWFVINQTAPESNVKEEKKEPFNETGTEFVPFGSPRYDLRGVRLNTSPVEWKLYHNIRRPWGEFHLWA